MPKKIPLKYYISKNAVTTDEKFLKRTDINYDYRAKVSELNTAKIPFLVFGVSMSYNLLISLHDDGDWGMMEICRFDLKDGRHFWFTIDSYLDGTQFIGLPHNFSQFEDDIKLLFPATKYEANLKVEKNNDSYHVRYKRMDGQDIEFISHYRPKPTKPLFQNGNPMNHSEKVALFSICLESLQFLGSSIEWKSKAKKIQTIFFKKFHLMLKQSACGFMEGEFSQDEKFLYVGDKSYPVSSEKLNDCYVLKVGSYPELSYIFNKSEDMYELKEIIIDSIGSIKFSPSFVDTRYEVDQAVESFFTLSIKDKKPYMCGKVSGSCQDGAYQFKIQAQKPSWNKNRHMLIKLKKDGSYAKRI